MLDKCLKSLLVLAFSLFLTVFSNTAFAQEHGKEAGAEKTEGKLNMKEVIFGHVMDGHEFHFFGASLPLPVLLYSPQRGFSAFMSSNFHHGHEPYKDYVLLNAENIKEQYNNSYFAKNGQIMNEELSLNLFDDKEVLSNKEVFNSKLLFSTRESNKNCSTKRSKRFTCFNV